MLKRIALAMISVSVVVVMAILAYKAWNYRTAALDAQSKLSVMAFHANASEEFSDKIVRRDARLNVTGDLDKRVALVAIRDYVHRSFDNGPEEIPGLTPDIAYAALGSDKNNMYCGGASLAYTWALNAVGIPARFIQLGGEDFLAGRDMYQTHATVEAMMDGKWEISDPTFNISIRCSDNDAENLSVHGVRACLARQSSLKFIAGESHAVDRKFKPDKYTGYFAAFTRRAIISNTVNEPEDSYPNNNWVEMAMKAYKKD